MKKLLFILLTSLAFGQNVELLKKANNADETFAKTFAQDIYPNYQTIDTYKEGLYYSYILVPAGTSQNEISECKLGNPCQKGVTVKYKVLNGNYIFSSAKGDGNSLFAFWTKEIQPVEKTTDTKTYKNKVAKVWYNLEPTPKTWMIVNMSDRSETQW